MSEIKVSIIMGIYNCEPTLSMSIESIISQTFKEWELIMCDDGSQDNTCAIALKYSLLYPNKIKVLTNDKNEGLNFTLNKCFQIASGNFIARQDGDDISLPNRLKMLYDFLIQNPAFSIVSSKMIHFDEHGDFGISKVVQRPTKNDFIYGTPFCHAASMFKRSAFLSVNGYSESKYLIRVEDYDLWSKMYAKGLLGANIEGQLYKMRDDRNALFRRKYKFRINEALALFQSYRRLKINIMYYIFILRPLIIGLLPTTIYHFFRKKKFVTHHKHFDN